MSAYDSVVGVAPAVGAVEEAAVSMSPAHLAIMADRPQVLRWESVTSSIPFRTSQKHLAIVCRLLLATAWSSAPKSDSDQSTAEIVGQNTKVAFRGKQEWYAREAR